MTVPRRRLRRAALAVLAACAATAACVVQADARFEVGDRPAAADATADAVPPALRLFATGETLGFFVPCGCESDQRGGIARRKGWFDAVGAPDDVRIDLGNAGAGGGSPRRRRIATTFEALAAMRYAAFVPGRIEVAAGDDLLAVARGHPEVAVVCSNLVGADGRAAFPASIVASRRVAVVGVTEVLGAAPGAWRTMPAAPAVRAALDALGGRVDAAIVAAAMPWEEAVALARSLEDDDRVVLVVAGTSAYEPRRAPAATRIPVAAAGDRGEYVLRVDLGPSLRPSAAWREWLVEGLPEDEAMASLVKRHKKELAELEPEFVPDVLDGLRARGFVGSAACRDCHEADHAVWAGSGHAHAMRTLVERDSERDPECVPCHLVDVAWDEAGPRDVRELGVGCETCHGGGARHVASAMQGERPIAGTTLRAEPHDCAGCHRPPEVTRFDAREAWPKILHGGR